MSDIYCQTAHFPTWWDELIQKYVQYKMFFTVTCTVGYFKDDGYINEPKCNMLPLYFCLQTSLGFYISTVIVSIWSEISQRKGLQDFFWTNRSNISKERCKIALRANPASPDIAIVGEVRQERCWKQKEGIEKSGGVEELRQKSTCREQKRGRSCPCP